ncbi:MAG: hypothetical protein E6J34_06790 [Chloroflexi bacterium]|nr:MAG: hypothetical protein E6J34_06790 [Chloroflexota bacterium]
MRCSYTNYCGGLLLMSRRLSLKISEIFQEQAMHEDIPPTDTPEQQTHRHVIQKGLHTPGKVTRAHKQMTQQIMPQHGPATTQKPDKAATSDGY